MFYYGLSEEGFFESLSHDLAAWFSPRPEADPDHTLVDQHAQSVENRAPAQGRVPQELRPWRIGDEIADDHAGLERSVSSGNLASTPERGRLTSH